MAVTRRQPRQGCPATVSHTPESLSSAVGLLFLGAFPPNLVIFFSIFSCFITRSSIMTTNDIDSVARGAVAQRACQGREWVTAIDAHCSLTTSTIFRRQQRSKHCRNEIFPKYNNNSKMKRIGDN
ncbi:hypothetical protein Y032_0049g1749 [Ancylostoma ceylanicum]|uniref:Uncharacterized protein n=1 Tax=Ancylostoma ceylanicum TaxID=53326 RepID=A0A016UAW4_9BILA|nr:hypothetical protein Y032_0049g1749 [Ancylostoma ceylanicum]